MKTMKFSMKVLMAMLLMSMPLVFTSCGDDDDNGPKTYEYSWSIDYSTPSSWTSEQKKAALDAEDVVGNSLAAQLRTTAKATVSVSDQKFSITGGEKDANDKLVKAAVLTTSASLDEATKNAFPSNTKLTVKRGSSQVTSERLK